ncbi:MAG TPA: periplasmic heavy metal sensor [Chitinophagaceae bacterium]|nr:periplasmic heavy metal sensor [Chitinophagaceae bacterium]
MKNSTNKILIAALVLLLIVNLAMVFFMVKGKPSRGKHRSPSERLVKEIGMTEEQRRQYDSLREMHFSKVRPLLDSMRRTRQALFNLMKEEQLNDSVIGDYSTSICEKQTRADRMTLEHFRRVRAMFSGEQQKKFDAFVEKMMQRPGPGRRSDNRK